MYTCLAVHILTEALSIHRNKPFFKKKERETEQQARPANLLKKTLARVFSCEFCEFRNF